MNPHDVWTYIYWDLAHDSSDTLVNVRVMHAPTGLSVEKICLAGSQEVCRERAVGELAQLVANSPYAKT
jgi:hypothetical protein